MGGGLCGGGGWGGKMMLENVLLFNHEPEYAREFA
jgi:hypothetical protein